MAWVESAGGALVYTGRLGAAGDFRAWAAGPGREAVRALAARQRWRLLGGEHRARRRLWQELRAAAAPDGALGAALQQEAARYPRLPGELAQTVQPDKFVADWRPFVIPRFLVNEMALRGLYQRLGSAHALSQLQGGEALHGWFLHQFVAQMDAAWCRLPFGIRAPVPSAHEWVVIDFDPRYDWGHPRWRGHCYVVQTKAVEIGKARAQTLQRSLAELKAVLGRFSGTQVRELSGAWQGWLDGHQPRLHELAASLG
ncbi:hypothetical protein [Azohydromonas aeria]|uniref:hypothetical protein n=1 Tax=Azohydromonas aeria TaxID=2590212 RepID=UPI0012F8B7B2|nr:hypothetical protein [Azohydromonas aeria]